MIRVLPYAVCGSTPFTALKRGARFLSLPERADRLDTEEFVCSGIFGKSKSLLLRCHGSLFAEQPVTFEVYFVQGQASLTWSQHAIRSHYNAFEVTGGEEIPKGGDPNMASFSKLKDRNIDPICLLTRTHEQDTPCNSKKPYIPPAPVSICWQLGVQTLTP